MSNSFGFGGTNAELGFLVATSFLIVSVVSHGLEKTRASTCIPKLRRVFRNVKFTKNPKDN